MDLWLFLVFNQVFFFSGTSCCWCINHESQRFSRLFYDARGVSFFHCSFWLFVLYIIGTIGVYFPSSEMQYAPGRLWHLYPEHCALKSRIIVIHFIVTMSFSLSSLTFLMISFMDGFGVASLLPESLPFSCLWHWTASALFNDRSMSDFLICLRMRTALRQQGLDLSCQQLQHPFPRLHLEAAGWKGRNESRLRRYTWRIYFASNALF